MDNSKLDSLIAAEAANLAKLNNKLDTIEAKIKTCKGKIERYNLMKNNAQFILLSDALSNAGIGFDDIISALSDGDVLSLQSKLVQSAAAVSS
jgi:hypothetical protein